MLDIEQNNTLACRVITRPSVNKEKALSKSIEFRMID